MTDEAIDQLVDVFRFLLGVTFQAPTHVHAEDWPSLIHGTNVAVTGFAIDSRSKVRPVTKVNEIWLIVDAHPGDGLALFAVAGELPHRFILGSDDLVTAHTPFHGWYASDAGTSSLGMAIEALDASFDVGLMAVGDRLLRCGQETGAGDKDGDGDAHGHDQYDEQKPANRLARLFG